MPIDRSKSPLTLNVDNAKINQEPKSGDRSPNIISSNPDLVRELVRKRGIVKGRLTKFSNYLQSLQDSENPASSSRDRIDLKLRIKGASSLFTEFNDIQNKIEENVYDSEIPDQLTNRESFENSYYSTIALAESMLSMLSGDEVTDCSNTSCCSDKSKLVKLPTISMPTFDGSYEHWLEFRDTFLSLVHNSKQISSIQKFHYLKSSLKGSAMLVLESLEFSSDNYSVAWELLLNRYNNSRLLVHNHVKALFTINALPKESSACIRKLIDTILKNLRALKILGEPTENWDTLINYIIVSKLDKTTEREWETHKCTLLVSDSDSRRIIKLTDLIGFLKDRADMLETLQLSHSKGQGHHSQHDNKKHTTHNTSHCNVSTNKPQDRLSRSYKPCVKCNASHPLYSCQNFLDCDLESKLKLIRDHKLCENCLRSGHASDTCKFGPCRKCNQKHNSLIHKDNTSSVTFHSSIADKPSGSSTASAETLPIHVNKAHMHTRNTSTDMHTVLLSTAVVEVADPHGAYRKARALLDNGSQRCFISKSFCKLINAQLLQSTHEVRGVGDSVIQCSQTCSIEIKSHVDNTFITRIDCFVLDQITSTIPALCQMSSAQLCLPDNIRLADPQFLDSKDVDILIGADRFWDLLGEGKFRLPSGPYLQNTKLGWIISGPIINKTLKVTRINCNFSSSIDTQLRSFWEIEELQSAKDTRTEEERACEEHFLRTTTRDSVGRFSVRIPFKESPSLLGDSYDQAERRFTALEKRLQRSPDYKLLYANFMKEYESLGHMSPVSSYDSPCYFMPHHGVYREHSTTTKLRVVFDASAPSSSGKSLNDLQLVGPAIQGDLLSILLRFRQHKFVVCADVTKMFRNCLVDKDQRNLQMILWRDDPSKPLAIYSLNTVTYGTSSAPFLSVRCLKQLGIESSNPDVQRVVKDDFYVDDLLTGCSDKASLLKLCDDIKVTLQSGCFPLQKWMYNFQLETDDDDEFSNQSKEIKYSESVSSKTLGLGWNNSNDEFYFSTQFQNDGKPVTKRSILSNISQIFDPLGLLSPTIIIAKVLIQQLWLLKIGWDETVPCSVAQTWNRFVISLQKLNTVRIPRHAIGSQPIYIELHVFSDASQTAYGACIYVRTVNEDQTLSVRLLTSKAKVAPLKPISIPRLELCGALLGAKLLDKVRSSLTCKVDNVVCWTDSTIVLGWLHMTPNKLKTFVQSRHLARHVVNACVRCTRMKGKILTPFMGDLPKERITPSFPFNRCGVDYCGPVLVLNRKGRGAKTSKAYICLFVCFVTRAIHLELVSDLTTEAYLLALNRFISRRSKPIEIFSDNGRNFVGLMKDFSNFLQRCSASIVEYATSQQIKFKFIPPYSPHFGGLWEAGVKSCKHHLRRVVGNARLTFEEFYTVLSQIEAVLNSRPLSPLSPDPKDFTPLTPGHFLVGRPLTAPASDDLNDIAAHRLNRYQRVEQIRQHFWTRWSKEYVSELQVRNKWTDKTMELKTNSLVLIKDNNLPPLKWHMGRVLATIPGKDGISRVADIQTASGVVRRSYAKICPLVQDAHEESTDPEER